MSGSSAHKRPGRQGTIEGQHGQEDGHGHFLLLIFSIGKDGVHPAVFLIFHNGILFLSDIPTESVS